MPARSAYHTQDAPNEPGVYLFRDRFQHVIYVGKAKSLRRRLASYFQPSRQRTDDPKLRSLINSIAFYELYPVHSEAESLLLESRLIKQYTPRYNILLRDDKRFLLIRIDVQAPFPRLTLARLRKDDGQVYYGPFPLAGALRDTVDFLTRRFGLRSCRAVIPGALERRHCLDHIVRDCSAPCVLKITREQYQERVAQLRHVIEGNVDELIAEVEAKMAAYSAAQQFELAARMRDVKQNLLAVFATPHRAFAYATASTHYPGPAGVAGLQTALELVAAPRVIECFDNSNILGQFAVASLVRFVDGTPAKSDYRHFRIRTVTGADDFASMAEVVGRRYGRLQAEGRPLPDLVVVDGGLGQLNAAYRALQTLGLTKLPLIALAKKQEEVYTIYSEEPLRLDTHAAGLKLLQALRDEAHRFAISFHRDLRRQRIQESLLDEVPGIGKTRKEELLKAFGSVRHLRHQTPAAVAERVPGIGEKLAGEVLAYLRGEATQDQTEDTKGTKDATGTPGEGSAP